MPCKPSKCPILYIFWLFINIYCRFLIFIFFWLFFLKLLFYPFYIDLQIIQTFLLFNWPNRIHACYSVVHISFIFIHALLLEQWKFLWLLFCDCINNFCGNSVTSLLMTRDRLCLVAWFDNSNLTRHKTFLYLSKIMINIILVSHHSLLVNWVDDHCSFFSSELLCIVGNIDEFIFINSWNISSCIFLVTSESGSSWLRAGFESSWLKAGFESILFMHDKLLLCGTEFPEGIISNPGLKNYVFLIDIWSPFDVLLIGDHWSIITTDRIKTSSTVIDISSIYFLIMKLKHCLTSEASFILKKLYFRIFAVRSTDTYLTCHESSFYCTQFFKFIFKLFNGYLGHTG